MAMTNSMKGTSSIRLHAICPMRAINAGENADPIATPSTQRIGMASGFGRSIGNAATEAIRQNVSAPRNQGSGSCAPRSLALVLRLFVVRELVQAMGDLGRAVAGDFGGRVGVAPRVFLKKLVTDVLDRVDQFDDFNPRKDYKLTVSDLELTEAERALRGASKADDIELKW